MEERCFYCNEPTIDIDSYSECPLCKDCEEDFYQFVFSWYEDFRKGEEEYAKK